MRYKVPVTLTISLDAFVEAGSPEGAVTDVGAMLELDTDTLEDSSIFFEEDAGIEIENTELIGKPSFGVVEEAPAEGDATEELDQTPETSVEATPPKDRDLK